MGSGQGTLDKGEREREQEPPMKDEDLRRREWEVAEGPGKTPQEDQEDEAADAFPEDSSSMSVGPPSGDARVSSEAVGSPQANPDHEGPSPPHKMSTRPAPHIRSPGAQGSEPPPKKDVPPADSTPDSHPAHETLETLGEESRHEGSQGAPEGGSSKGRGRSSDKRRDRGERPERGAT